MLPQSSRMRPAHCRALASGTAISNSRPRSTWSKATPTCRAVTPEEPSAPMMTLAVTVLPSASRAYAWPASWPIARTVAFWRTRAPAASARSSSAASNSSRMTMVSNGLASVLVNSWPPRNVMVAVVISSRAGRLGRSFTAFRDAPISPPPQVL